MSRGPLSVLLDAEFLQFYHSGVWDPWLCDSSDLDHGVGGGRRHVGGWV